jgi:hypothetical protein
VPLWPPKFNHSQTLIKKSFSSKGSHSQTLIKKIVKKIINFFYKCYRGPVSKVQSQSNSHKKEFFFEKQSQSNSHKKNCKKNFQFFLQVPSWPRLQSVGLKYDVIETSDVITIGYKSVSWTSK